MIAVTAALVSMLGLSVVAAQQGPSASRSFDTTMVAPDGHVMVTITVANYGLLGGVTETLPEGFSYESSSLDDNQVHVSTDPNNQEISRVRFTLQGDTSFTYTVSASSTPGSYNFSGTLRDSDRSDHDVSGADRITVSEDASGMTPEATDEQSEEQPSAERSLSRTSVSPGGRIVVTMTAANYGQAGGVTETLPGGFTYVSSSLDEDQVSVMGRDVRFTLQGDTSFTYTVTASNTSGPYTFSGTLRDFDRMDYDVMGDASVTVRSVGGARASATRSFAESSVALGAEVVVTITADNYGQAGGVTETLPEGFSYVTSSLDAGQVTINGQEVRFTLQGDASFTYTIVASSTQGSYEFSGKLRDFDRMDHTIGGETTVTAGPYATRSFAPTSVTPGGRVVVTITANNYGQAGGVTETLPEGFTYVSSSLGSGQVTASGQEIRFTLQGDESFTYRVTASRTIGSHSFSGVLRDFDRMDYAVGGTTSVSVRTPTTGSGGGGSGSGGGGTGSGGGTTGGETPATTTPDRRPPIIVGGTREEINVAENMTAVTSLKVADGRRVTWSIVGGFDAAKFSIGADSGALTFTAAPDFENPTDAGADNEYWVDIGATDADALSDSIVVVVTVTDVVDETTATPEATVAPTATPEATVAPTATPEPTVAPTATPEPTVAPTATPEPTVAPTATPEPTVVPTATPEPTVEPTATPEPTAAPTATTAPVPTVEPTTAPATPTTEPTVAPATPTTQPTTAPPTEGPDEGGIPLFLVIIGIVVSLGLLVGGILYLRSR